MRTCDFVEVDMVVLEWRQAVGAYVYDPASPSVSVHFLLPLNQDTELSAPCLPASCLLPAMTMD